MAGGLLGGMAMGGNSAAGAYLGQARGSVTIDTSGAEVAAPVVRRVGQDMEKAFEGASAKAKSFSQGLKDLRMELLAIGAAGGILAGIGIGTAGQLEQARVQLKGMVGSVGETDKLMQQLQKDATAAGVPLADMVAMATRLLPALEGDVRELAKWEGLARRLATLNQREGLAGAAFAITEALSSGGTDLMSLAERFSISRTALREALAETGGDFAAALDMVLNRMGATEEAADEMGRTFNASFRLAKDAAAQLLAAGFRPLLDALTPLLRGAADLLNKMRETHPELGLFASGVASIAVVGAPALLFLTQMVSLMSKLKELGWTAQLGGAGKAGVYALAGIVGAGGGIEVGRAIGRATGNESMAQGTMASVWEGIRKGLANMAYVTMAWNTLVEMGLLRATRDFIGSIADMMGAMGRFNTWVGSILPGPLGAKAREAGQMWLQGSEELRERAARAAAEQSARLMRQLDENTAKWIRGLGLGQYLPQPEAPTAAPGAPGAEQPAIDAIMAWAEAVEGIETQANEQRLQTTEQYEAQRASTIASYEQQIAREAEDYGRQRARQEAQLQRDILAIQQDAAAREAQWQQDLADRLADMRAESNQRIADMEAEHALRMEQMQRDHRDRLLEAAARLDARAVAEEQRRYQNQVTDAEQDLQRRVALEGRNLAERIQQEQEAHARRLATARAADAQRIADMTEALRLQQAQEDEDRAVRLKRMQEDHGAQLAELDRQHRKRLDQINRQAAQERARLDWAFVQQCMQEVSHTSQWLALQARRQADSLTLFNQFWAGVDALIASHMPGASSGGGCFVAGTPVLMADGSSRPIEEVRPGDEVASFDPETGQMGAGRVTRIMRRHARQLYTLRLEDGRQIRCTGEHPFYLPGYEGPAPRVHGHFVRAKHLRAGDCLLTELGPVPLATVAVDDWQGAVFNLNVEPSHTYVAGGALVHNVKAFQAGGPVPYTGLAMLHGSRSRPEYVLSADTYSMLRTAMGGGGFTQRQLVAAVAGGVSGGGPRLHIGEFKPTIVLGDVGKRSDAQILELVERGMMRVFTQLASG